MRTHRLSRLALLTHGAALVGLGVACGKDAAPKAEPPHVDVPLSPATVSVPNSPASPSPVAPAPEGPASQEVAPTTGPAPDSGRGLVFPRPKRTNAPPFRPPPEDR